jgi:predicted O-linked N-acetylglucosamine transferase (SPINDLY family)
LQALQQFEQAAEVLTKLVAIAPDYQYARGRLLECRLHCADWANFDADAGALVQVVEAGEKAIAPFAFLAVSDAAPTQLRCARIFAADKFPPAPASLWRGDRYAHERIRVAYVSADFRDHPLAHLMAGVFEQHDRARFETIAVSLGREDGSSVRRRLRSAFDRFIDAEDRADRDIALLLRSLEVDIAVDLMGFTAGSRTGVLAWRPAPVQVNYLGFPATMGADYIDYIIGDRCLIPEALRPSYAEAVVWLPDCFQANSGARDMAPPRTRRELRLPDDGVVFCSFNTTYKIVPRIFDSWMRILAAIPGSVLWLLGGTESVCRNLRREASQRGIDPARLVFAQRLPYAEHLARYVQADLFLDTLPFNGGATTSDALWTGLPVLTCSGEAFASRMAGSLLHVVGAGDCIARSLDEYERLAIDLANHPERLQELRRRLARNRRESPLYDSARFCRHLEAAYSVMRDRQRAGESPRGFAVE